MRTRWLGISCFLLTVAAHAAVAPAEPMPTPAALQAMLHRAPVTVSVVEPHLSHGGKQVRVRYRGFAAVPALTALLGAGWNAPEREVEFRALDGYVSHIPVDQFAQHAAYLVFARGGAHAFDVDDVDQRQKHVPLGPYYLVWDNVKSPELIADGASRWPYQIAHIASTPSSKLALLPPALGPGYAEHAALAQQFCLSCHQINGFGGDKMPINLAARAKMFNGATWRAWLLAPQLVKPGTTMPPVAGAMAQAEREAIADKLYVYLRALPVTDGDAKP